VQNKAYRERAAAISFTEGAKNAHLKNCQAIGRQDVLYGDQGASIYWEGGLLSGGVDFIFGAMTMVVDHATIIANITDEPNDKCYISAGRSEGRGMLFYHCHIQSPVPGKVWLARPWRPWGETVWAYTTWDKDVLHPEAWNTGLIRKREDFDPENPCPKSYEYRSQDHSAGRPKWVSVLRKPILPDGARLTPKAWLSR
jgi:pectin methylesterase-like acyl-CoA thioesterase